MISCQVFGISRHRLAIGPSMGHRSIANKLGVKMTSFRRLVMGIAETMAVLSIIFGTFYGGILGAASQKVCPTHCAASPSAKTGNVILIAPFLLAQRK